MCRHFTRSAPGGIRSGARSKQSLGAGVLHLVISRQAALTRPSPKGSIGIYQCKGRRRGGSRLSRGGAEQAQRTERVEGVFDVGRRVPLGALEAALGNFEAAQKGGDA